VRGFLISIVVLAVAVFVVVPYFVLPASLEYVVAQEIQRQLGLPEAPGVELDSDPQWEMLTGEFSEGRVTVEGANLGGVRAESVSIELDPFSVDVPESVRSRFPVVRQPVSGLLRLEVSEAEVGRLAAANAGVPVTGVDLTSEGATIRSEATALGTTFPVSVEGDVGVSGGSLAFRPQGVEAAGTPIPGWLAQSLLAGTAFQYPVGGLPFGSTITGAKTVDGGVVITGRVPGIPIGNPSG
jgi:hypothetical protein